MKYFITSEKNSYKANLHNHSTATDGRLTPEEIKREYMTHGYSIVAFTDHGNFYNQTHLTDENFLALYGFEFGCAEYKGGHPKYYERRNCDIGIIAPSPDFKGGLGYEDTWFDYGPDIVNEVMKAYRDAGCFVIHNHPDWSLERYPDYIQYKYMHATEIFNYSSYVGGYLNPTDHVLDDMLANGKKVFAVAADDNHNKGAVCDSFGAWCVINAEKLDYPSVMDSLFNGKLYSSTGPEIHDLYVDDNGILRISCSDAKMISFITSSKVRGAVCSEDGQPINKASFEIRNDIKYVRVIVKDYDGNCAYSNPIFTDELNTVKKA